MADVQPFRAVRYAGAAGPLADLVAPPYDTVDDVARAALYTRSPYNVAHVTLPESALEAGRLYRDWLDRGILEEDDEAAIWVAVESYVGPDGVSRERHGAIVSIAAEPYETRAVLPHEETHAEVRDERLELLRATRVQPEPVLLLSEETIDLEVPDDPPDIEVASTRLWRITNPRPRILEVGQLVIADGHHRYESAAAYGSEPGGLGARIMALVVSTSDPGLHVFPTHRVFEHGVDIDGNGAGDRFPDVASALDAVAVEPVDRAAAVVYRRDGAQIVRGAPGELDTELVERYGRSGVRYTPRADEAVGWVEGGEAEVAFLLRDPRVEDVFAAARTGRRMPPKSTYFYPKPLSGLLFHSVTT